MEPQPTPGPHAYGANGLGRLRNPISEPRASHILFVVREADLQGARGADIVVQTSDTTWQACVAKSAGGGRRPSAHLALPAHGAPPRRAAPVASTAPRGTADQAARPCSLGVVAVEAAVPHCLR